MVRELRSALISAAAVVVAIDIRKQDSTWKTRVTVSLPIDLDNEDDGFSIASTVSLLLLRAILKILLNLHRSSAERRQTHCYDTFYRTSSLY